MLKGNEIGWPVPVQFLRPCLACRDALNWVKVNILLGPYEVNDLLRVRESHLPLEQFSFCVNTMTPELICLIRKFSPSLEILHIGFHSTEVTKLVIL